MFIVSQAKEVDQMPLQKSHPAKMLGLLVAGKLQEMLHTRVSRVWFAGAAHIKRTKGFSHTNAVALLTLSTTSADVEALLETAAAFCQGWLGCPSFSPATGQILQTAPDAKRVESAT